MVKSTNNVNVNGQWWDTVRKVRETDLPAVLHGDDPHAVERESMLDDRLLLFARDVRPVEEALHAGHLDAAALVIVDGCAGEKEGEKSKQF